MDRVEERIGQLEQSGTAIHASLSSIKMTYKSSATRMAQIAKTNKVNTLNTNTMHHQVEVPFQSKSYGNAIICISRCIKYYGNDEVLSRSFDLLW